GWTRQTVYEAEKGERDFRVSELIALAQAAQVQVWELVDAGQGKRVEIARGKTISAESLHDLFKEPGAAKGPAWRAMLYLGEIVGALETLQPAATKARREL